MKIVFLVTSLDSGGIENYLLRFLNFFNGKIQPIVICKSGKFGELEEAYRQITNIQILPMKMGFFNPLDYQPYYHLLKKEQPNAICDFTGNFSGIPILVAKWAKVKNRVSFYRNSTMMFKENQIKLHYVSFLNRLIFKNATDILSNSQTAFKRFFTKTDSRFRVIYNGIDAESFHTDESKNQIRNTLGIAKDDFVVGHTGRVHFSKNHKTIVEVAEKLVEKYPKMKFLFCGKGTDTHFTEILKEKKLTKHFYLLGYRNDVHRVLKSLDLYFFPSVTEGQPNSLIEAMISNLPIVTSDIAPIQETVPNKFRRELVAPLDVDGFCQKIDELYLGNDKQESFREYAIEKFNPSEQFGAFYKIITR